MVFGVERIISLLAIYLFVCLFVELGRNECFG